MLQAYSNQPVSKQLARLDEFDALPPEIKKRLRYRPGGGVIDLAEERVSVMYELAVHAYNVADTQYWKHHDPTEIPNPGESGPEGAAVDVALARIARARTPPKPTKRPPAPDFGRAKEAFAYVAEHADPKSYWHRDARRMLASIALREGRPRDAIRWCEQLPGDPCPDRMAWAYLQLGDRKTAMKWLARDNGPSHRGLLAELSGDDAAAVTAYREPMTSEIPYWQAYNTARLRRIQARIGKPAYARLVGPRPSDEWIRIASIADFHARFADLATAVRAQQKITAPPAPLTDAAIDKLWTHAAKNSRVPPSVRTILRTDRNFRLWKEAEPLLGDLRVVNVDALFRRGIRATERELRASIKVPTKLPVCLSLATPGDQDLLLVLGTTDATGEVPIARFDEQQVELWISDASLVHYILATLGEMKLVKTKLGLAKAKQQAKRRNRF